MEGLSGLGAVAAVPALGTLLQVTDQPQGGFDHSGLAIELVQVGGQDGRSITLIREYWDTLTIAQLAGR